MNLNIKLPDLSKIESVKSDLVGKITSTDIGSTIKGKVSNIANEYGSKIKDNLGGQLSNLTSGFTSNFQMPNMDSIDMGNLDVNSIDMNSQLQEYLNGFDINSM